MIEIINKILFGHGYANGEGQDVYMEMDINLKEMGMECQKIKFMNGFGCSMGFGLEYRFGWGYGNGSGHGYGDGYKFEGNGNGMSKD